jgi:uncharacterized membrane protein (UPF0136 family)
MKISGGIVLAYGVVVMLGGLIAYLKADSLTSLFTATIAGAALVAGGMGLIRNSIYAYFVSVAVTTLLAVFFMVRYIITEKMMPSGMMAGLSVIVLLLLLVTKGRHITNKIETK